MSENLYQLLLHAPADHHATQRQIYRLAKAHCPGGLILKMPETWWEELGGWHRLPRSCRKGEFATIHPHDIAKFLVLVRKCNLHLWEDLLYLLAAGDNTLQLNDPAVNAVLMP